MNLHISIPAWMVLPAIFILVGLAIGMSKKPTGGWDLDPVTPLLVLVCFAVAVALVIGHFI